MPRHARLDIPGLLQHVMVRGIDRRNIFRDNTDRKNFVERLSTLLTETGTDCLAWALIPNHFHLLLRPNRIELQQFMRRLLTGYAIGFNTRHRRSGHVFQNRYKSIVCEEESYLLELVRYIHLNPLRAGLVPDLAGLKAYRWCGHRVVLGDTALGGQAVDPVLARFGKDRASARNGYLRFVADGISLGKQPNLVGGGLRRSQGGSATDGGEPEAFDERVLGRGAFVEELRREEKLRDRLLAGLPLAELQQRVEACCGLEAGQLAIPSRTRAVVEARDLFCSLAVRRLKYPGTKVGEVLGIRRSAVSHAVRRGGRVLARVPKLESDILFR